MGQLEMVFSVSPNTDRKGGGGGGGGGGGKSKKYDQIKELDAFQ